MPKMLGKQAVRCIYGCCRVAYSSKGRKTEKRAIKRGERNNYKREITTNNEN